MGIDDETRKRRSESPFDRHAVSEGMPYGKDEARELEAQLANLQAERAPMLETQLMAARNLDLYGPVAVVLLALVVSQVLTPWTLFIVVLAAFLVPASQ